MGIFIFLISENYPHITEKVYSSFVYKYIGQTLSSITGILPFSLAEFVIVFSVVFLIKSLLRLVSELKRSTEKKKILKKFIYNMLTIIGIIYFSFQIMWGLNYNRITVDLMFNLDTKNPTQEELVGLCENLIISANNLRAGLHENDDGVMTLPYKKSEVLNIAYKGFQEASLIYPNLDVVYGKPKALILSKLMCYTGITGFIFPFTGEANVNMATPDPFLPYTVTHEMAHQQGFAREDEANYIAYITCINHSDIYFQYSGTLSALNYCMNALQKTNSIKYYDLLDTFDEGIINDLNFNKAFWKNYSGPVEKVSNKINDTYLKTQKQKAGVKSYGAVVDLLIAEYRKNK